MFFNVSPFLPFFLAMLLLTLPLRWLLASVFAAAFHELCHVLGVILSGGTVQGFSLSVGGAVIHARVPGRFRELASIAAGPLGSLSLFFLFRFWPEAAICGFLQGICNLLPLPWTDGGRLLCLLLDFRLFRKIPGKSLPNRKKPCKEGGFKVQ